MEPIRPRVDAYVLDWIRRETLSRNWFFEQRDGNCRLMGSFAVRLSETAQTWGRSVAPVAEWACRTFSSSIPKRAARIFSATRLTQSYRRQAKGTSPGLPVKAAPRPTTICRNCGVPIAFGDRFCQACSVAVARKNLIEAAKLGRVATHSPKAEALRAATMRTQEAAKRAWRPSDLPEWLTENVYREQIQPRLATFTVSAVSSALGVSKPYATDIRSGKRVPHPRHWFRLARFVEVAQSL